jgi:hypothetical protein
MSKTDKSTKVGGRRNATGNDMSAGNSVTRPGTRRSFQNSKTTAVARQDKRSTKYIHGKEDAVS